MIIILNLCRETLEDLGGGLGATDPVSGEVVVEMERSLAGCGCRVSRVTYTCMKIRSSRPTL